MGVGRFARACICSAILVVVATACGGRATRGNRDGGVYDCVDLFYGGTPARCCPDPPPDCTNKPNGYPGYPCVDPHNEYCSCSCGAGSWSCAC